MPGFNPHKFRAKQIAVTDSDDDSTGSDVDQPAVPAPTRTKEAEPPTVAALPAEETVPLGTAPSVGDEAPKAPPLAAQTATESVADTTPPMAGGPPVPAVEPGREGETREPLTGETADADVAKDNDAPSQSRQGTAAPGDFDDSAPLAGDDDHASAADLVPAYSMAAAPNGRGWTMTESAADGPDETAEPAPNNAPSSEDEEGSSFQRSTADPDGPSSPAAESSAPRQSADAAGKDATPCPKDPATERAEECETVPHPPADAGGAPSTFDSKGPPSASDSAVEGEQLPPPVTVASSTSRRSSNASARATGGVFSRLYNPSLLEQRRTEAKLRAERRQRDELARTAENLTFQPKLRENPFVQVHSRYHYGRPLEAHDPKWLKKQLQEQEARVQRDGH